MKKMLLVFAVAVVLGGCASEDNAGYNTGSAPVAESSRVAGNQTEVPDAAGGTSRVRSEPRMTANSTNTVNATTSPNSADGASGDNVGKGSFEDQNLDGAQSSPAGLGAENPVVNSNGVGNAGSSASQNPPSTR